MGRIANGELLKRAEAAGLDIVITADQNIAYQQNLKERRIALVVLGSNIWPIVQNYEKAIRSHVDEAGPGELCLYRHAATKETSLNSSFLDRLCTIFY